MIAKIKETVSNEKRGARSRVMDALQLNVLGMLPDSPRRRTTTLGVLLRYAMERPTTSRRTPVDVSKLVNHWIEAVVGMCHAHDKDDYDAHDAKADELLTPLLAAPIKQVREFYHQLLAQMQMDKRVPFLVWISFEAWGKAVVDNAPDEGVKRLKTKLAQEIADIVEKPIAEQIPEAIKRALQWRDEPTLQAVKETLQSGAKPKLVGRESCLFLECGRGKKKVSVMI